MCGTLLIYLMPLATFLHSPKPLVLFKTNTNQECSKSASSLLAMSLYVYQNSQTIYASLRQNTLFFSNMFAVELDESVSQFMH